MKFQVPNSKETSSINFQFRLPLLWGGLGWGFLFFLLTTTTQAQNFEESKKATIPDEETTAATKPAEIEIANPNGVAEAMEKVFYKNAKRANLTDEKTQELIQIINERNQVLQDLDNRKKQANAPYSIEDPGTYYNFKIKEARNEYARKISTLVTYNQYGYFVVDNYRDEAKAKAKPEYLQLSKSNPDLSKDQKLKLYKLIYNYHLNRLITTAYFSFDTNLQKPKLGVLRFNFEKEFAKIGKEYNIKIAEPKTGNKNDFQWN